MRKLFKITIDTDDDNIYRFTPDGESRQYGAKEFVIKADDGMLKNFLRRCKAADEGSSPRSYRAVTYNEIITLIKNKNCNIYIFSNMYPKTVEELTKIMRG